MKLKMQVLLSLSLAVALGMPTNPVATEEIGDSVVGDVFPLQGHVVPDGPPLPVDKERNPSTRGSHCQGVLHKGKCYQFFKERKRAEDAEFFCQQYFAGGHLASITSREIHRELMSLILRQNGAYTRTWIGGLRYLKTGRFIWLDGSRWTYADWLAGEPNNTSNLEDCVEVLDFGNGKFNDFTCWEPQSFICSYPS